MDPNSIVGIVKPNGEKINLDHLNDKTRAAARTCVMAGLMRGCDAAGAIIYVGSNNEPQAAEAPPEAPGTVEGPAGDEVKAGPEKLEKPKGDNGVVTPEQEK